MATVITADTVPEAQPLTDGERLTLAEYRERCAGLESRGIEQRTELIRGVVRVTEPPDNYFHAAPDADFAYLLRAYTRATPGTQSLVAGTLELPDSSQSQLGPDHLLLILPECGGQMRRCENGQVVGVSEFVVETANTSVRTDLAEKRDLYEATGVREYFVHVVRDQSCVVYRAKDGRFRPAELDNGVFRSETFPGLHVDCDALTTRDFERLVATLERGLATPGHAAFVKQLATIRDERSGDSI